jgi:hypothetical protein
VSDFPASLLLVLGLAAAPARAQDSTRISADAPIVNFRLPSYTMPGGYRAWLVRGSEARVAGPNDIRIKELTLTIFSGDAHDRVETIILSPAARVAPEDEVADGDGAIRVINDNFEATGVGWRYEHKGNKVSIKGHVRVVLHSELKDLLK